MGQEAGLEQQDFASTFFNITLATERAMFKRWWFHPADWWEFWYPQSGAQGGGMVGAAIFIVAFSFLALNGR